MCKVYAVKSCLCGSILFLPTTFTSLVVQAVVALVIILRIVRIEHLELLELDLIVLWFQLQFGIVRDIVFLIKFTQCVPLDQPKWSAAAHKTVDIGDDIVVSAADVRILNCARCRNRIDAI